MLINLKLLELFFVHQLLCNFVNQLVVDANQHETHYHTFRSSPSPMNTHYFNQYQFYQPYVNTGHHPQFKRNSDPNAYSNNYGDAFRFGPQNRDLTALNSFQNINRLIKRNGPLYQEESQKEAIHLSSFDEGEPIYSAFASIDDSNDDDKTLAKYKDSPDYENSPNKVDDDVLVHIEPASGDDDFFYDDQDKWVGECSDFSGLQSPVHLNTRISKLDLGTELDIGVRYSKTLPATELVNNGHTVEFTIPHSAGDLVITGPALDYEVYRADAIHFHWGRNDSVGSEHVIDRKRFPLEMHIIHYNAKYKDLSDALNEDDGTVVVGILFKAGKFNAGIDPLVKVLKRIRCKNQSTMVRNLNMLRLFPSKVERFFQYYGSLTTPPCTKSVQWVIIENAVDISPQQLAYFRQITEDELCQEPIRRNWRNLQPLKDREIIKSGKI